VIVPLSVTALAEAFGVLALLALLALPDPVALLEHPAANVSSAIADTAATERDVLRFIAVCPSDVRDVLNSHMRVLWVSSASDLRKSAPGGLMAAAGI